MKMNRGHYGRLLAMAGVSFVAMFVLMYAMVDRFANVYVNLNQLYMAGLMTAAMVLIEIGLMKGMYPDRTMNAVVALAGAIALAVFWLLIRSQAVITDRQFLKSMIPHHAGALLMCREARIRDAAVRDLCRTILATQQAEIDFMKRRLAALEK